MDTSYKIGNVKNGTVSVKYGETAIVLPADFSVDPYSFVVADIDNRLREIERRLGIIK